MDQWNAKIGVSSRNTQSTDIVLFDIDFRVNSRFHSVKYKYV